jgi:hypothetical protein
VIGILAEARKNLARRLFIAADWLCSLMRDARPKSMLLTGRFPSSFQSTRHRHAVTVHARRRCCQFGSFGEFTDSEIRAVVITKPESDASKVESRLDKAAKWGSLQGWAVGVVRHVENFIQAGWHEWRRKKSDWKLKYPVHSPYQINWISRQFWHFHGFSLMPY